jgi:hypothetical protein
MSDSITEDGFSSDSLGPDSEPLSGVAALGRISGKLLKNNLTRNGIPLAFETDLLYLDVNTMRIGVKTGTPTHDLHVSGTTDTTDMIVDGTLATVHNVKINTDGSFSTLVGALNIVPTGSPTSIVIEHERVITDTLDINDNYIRALVADRDFELRPDGTGNTNFNANSLVDGDVGVSGSIFAQQNVNIKGIFTIGDTSYDTLTVNPDFTQSIIPGDDNAYDLGTTDKRWRRIYVSDNNQINTFVSTTATVSDQIYMAGNTISTLQSNDDLTVSSAEGTVTLGEISFKNNTITNLLDSAVTLTHSGNGYLRITGTFGFQVPAGDISQRPSDPDVGTTRWNTELQYLECWDGTIWQVSTGGGATVTTAFMEDLGHQYTLIFG